MPSIRDVAKQAGVSIATVSRVINGSETVAPHLRRKVMEAVEHCDYTPNVRRQTLDSIALLYLGPFSVGGPYDSACIEGMTEAMRGGQFDLTILDLHRDKQPEETLRQFLARKGIRAAILRSTIDQRDMVEAFSLEGLPLVVLGDHFDCHGVSFVYGDSADASRQAVEHLVTIGHRRIAFAACERDDGDHLDRLSAYRSVLDEHGLYDPRLDCRVPPHRLDGAQLLRNLLGMPNRPTALFIADPLVAVGAINEAHQMGVRVPEDLSVIGFDDSDLRTWVYPRMSAVCQNSKALGTAAWEHATQLAQSGPDSTMKNVVHDAWLDLANTTGAPPTEPDRIMPNGTRVKE